MSFHFTPDTLEQAYEYFRSTRPFKGWKLPPGDDVEFFVLAARDRGAHYRGPQAPGSKPELGVSINGVGNYLELLEALAHEMIHFHLDRIGGEAVLHGPDFICCARLVCRRHGFDFKEFAA